MLRFKVMKLSLLSIFILFMCKSCMIIILSNSTYFNQVIKFFLYYHAILFFNVFYLRTTLETIILWFDVSSSVLFNMILFYSNTVIHLYNLTE